MFPSPLGPILDDRLIVLMGYEYLSLIFGNFIYDKNLDFIRSYIVNRDNSKKILVEQLSGGHYGSWHKIYPEFYNNETIINIRLFEWLCFKVHFKGIVVKSEDFVLYVEDLENKKTLFADSLEDAKRNSYYTYK